MTTFILHGGQSSQECVNNDRFWSQCTATINKSTVTIALIYWARPEHKKITAEARDKANIIKQAGSKQVHFIVPNNAEEIERQLDQIDVIYFSGGDFEPLEKYSDDVQKLKNLINNKVFLGSSIGSFIVCEYFMSSFEDQDRGVLKGWGSLAMSVLCHWDKEDKAEYKLKSLQKAAPNLPILTLNETEFVQFIV